MKGHSQWKFSLQVISTPFYDMAFIGNILLRELMPVKYRKCINFVLQKSEVQPQLTKKLYYNEYMLLIMIKWKLNVILFILLKGNSYIVCIRIFLLWTYGYRGFKIFERYRQPTLEKYAAVTILRGCKLWSNNIRVRINYYCWSLWGRWRARITGV